MPKYKHFKGGIYEFVCHATDTETGKKLVIYKNEQGELYARPYDMFHETVQQNGQTIKRFTKIQ